MIQCYGTCVKELASQRFRTKLRSVINRRLSSLHRGHAFIAWLVTATFGFSIAVATSPGLHVWIHSDANKTEHTCAATLIGSGSYQHTAAAPVVTSFAAASQFSLVDSFGPQVVESIFLGASIFEHAPPTRA